MGSFEVYCKDSGAVVALKVQGLLLMMIDILHYLKDLKLWEL